MQVSATLYLLGDRAIFLNVRHYLLGHWPLLHDRNYPIQVLVSYYAVMLLCV